MTFKAIFIKTIQDILQKDRAHCEKIYDLWCAKHPKANINKEYSDKEAAALMAGFKNEASGILAWLIREGLLKEWVESLH